MTARIHRGLHRVGVVLAVPVLILAAALGIHEAMYPSGHLSPGPDGVPYYPSDYLVPVAVAVLALALYAAARAVGWVPAGFIGSDGTPSPELDSKTSRRLDITKASVHDGEKATRQDRIMPKAPKLVSPRTAGALAKPLRPSPELAAVVGHEPLARTAVVSKLWDYIRKHELQDPADRRGIIADDKLRPIFGAERVTMFELAKVIGSHLTAA